MRLAARRLGTTLRTAAICLMAMVLAVGLPLSMVLPGTADASTSGKYATLLSFELAGVDPAVVTAQGPDVVAITGRYTNTGDDPITELDYRFQRGKRLTKPGALKAEVADPEQPGDVINSPFRSMPTGLDPHASSWFSLRVPIMGDPDTTLAITRPGVYPVMVNINGTVQAEGGDFRARVGELHLLLTVISLPGSPSTGGTGQAADVGMLWPFVDRSHLGVDGVFLDDDLAAEVAPGGRLATLAQRLTSAPLDPNLVTLLVDPMLLDELDQMSHGYWVVAHPGTPQAHLSATAAPEATETTAPPETSNGTGAPEDTETDNDATETDAPSGAGLSGPGELTGPTGLPGATAGPPSEESPQQEDGATRSTGATGAPGQTDIGPPDTATIPPQAPQPPETQESQQTQQTPATVPPTEPTQPLRPQPADTVAGTGSADAAAFLGTLRDLAQRHRVVVLPYGDPDVVALVRANMTAALSTAVDQGRAVATRILGPEDQTGRTENTGGAISNLVIDVAVPPGGALTTQAWRALRTLGYHSAILAPAGVSSSGLSSSGLASSGTKPTGMAQVNLDDEAVPVAISGAGLASTLTDLLHDGQPAHWVRQVNTLAARFALHDKAVTADAVVIALPRQAKAPLRAGLTTMQDLLDDLSAAGLLAATPVTDIARSAAQQYAPHATFAYPADARAAELPARYLARIDALYTRMDVLHGALAPATDGPQPDDILVPLRESLLGTVSAALRRQSTINSPVLDTVNATLDWLYDGVAITRNTGSYTLASSNAPLLLTVQNTLPYEVSVQVQIVGGTQAGLTADDPGIITIGPGPRSVRVKFDSHVSRSGTFRVYAQLLTPTSASWGSAVPLTIDSRAYGALTVVLMAVAGGILLIMVIWRIAQRIRGRRARVSAVDTDPGGGQ